MVLTAAQTAVDSDECDQKYAELEASYNQASTKHADLDTQITDRHARLEQARAISDFLESQSPLEYSNDTWALKDPMSNEFGKLRFPSLELDRAERVLRSITKKSGLAPQIASTLPWVAVSFALIFGAAGIGTMLWEPQSTRNAVIGALAWLIGFPLILRIITPRIRPYPDSDLVELRHWGYGLTIDYLPLSSISIASYAEIPILKVGLLEISGYTQVRIFAFAFVSRVKANSILSYVKQPK
ncbi:hypothetical protein ACUIAJ_02645 [Dermabacteraceae bacterium CCM 9519]